MPQKTHEVKGYAGLKHSAVIAGKARVGDLLLHTWHAGESSMQMEVEAWKERMKRGEASRVEVIDVKTHKMETVWP